MVRLHAVACSMDTTTIEIRDDQLEQLKAMKRVDRESYKSVVDRLLEGDTDTEPMRVVPVEDVVGREVPSAQIDYVEIESRCRSAIEEVLTQ